MLSAFVVILIIVLIVLVLMGNKENTDINIDGSKESANQEEGDSIIWNKDTNFKQIAKDIEQKKKENKEDVEDLINLGVSYYNLDNLDKAVDAYEDAIIKDPENARVYGNLGNVLRDQRKYREAEESYRKAIQLDPNFINAYTSLAVMFYALENDKAGAIQILSQGLMNNPGNSILQGLLNNYSK